MVVFEIEVFTVRIDGEVVEATGIEDDYSPVQIHIEKKFLTEDDIRKYCRHMSQDYVERQVKEFNKNSNFVLRDEQEAKDICRDLSRVSTSIEKAKVDFSKK